MRSISFICRHDSSVKMSLPLAAEFKRRGWKTILYIVDIPSAQYGKIIAVSNTDDQRVIYVPSISLLLKEKLFLQSDVVHIVAEGSLVCELFVKMKEYPYKETRPLLISGLIGTLGSSETFFYFQRQMADLIYVGGDFDALRLRAVVSRFGDDPSKIVTSGLPIFDAYSSTHGQHEAIILFAGQPTYPFKREERNWVVLSLIEIAKNFPQKKVVLKPRVRPGEDTIYRPTHHYSDLLREFESVPENFEISFEPISELLPKSELVLTISSTVALEALKAGKNVGIISDFGIDEKIGNHIFVGSGAVTSFKELSRGKLPSLRKDWVKEFIVLESGASSRIYESVVAKLEDTKWRSKLQSFQSYYYFDSVYERDRALVAKSREGIASSKSALISILSLIFRVIRRNRTCNRFILKFIDVMKNVYARSN